MASKVNPGIEKLQDDGASFVQQSEITNLNPQKTPDDHQRPRYMKTKYELENQDVVQKAVHYVKVVLKMLPSVLGLLDEITDYTYYATQPFAHDSLKNAFLFYILFTPFLQTVIWDAYFAVMAHNKRDKTAYENIRRQYFQVELEKKRLAEAKEKGGLILTIKSSWLLFLMYIRETATFFYFMVYYSLISLIYAIMQEIKFLPFFITFFDPVLREIKYPITKDLIEEFKSKEPLLQAIEDIDLQNAAIDKINREIDLYNARKSSSVPAKPLRAKVKSPTIHPTDPLKSAEILSMEKSVSNQLLHDPYVESFLLVGEMVEAVFESLPMLTIQYINNSMLNLWGGLFNIFSFIFSVLMISIQCAKMVYAISESQTFPLLRFKDYAKKTTQAKERYVDPIWILQTNNDQVYQIHDIESMEKAAHANETFYKTVKSILYDVSGDERMIRDCLQGPQYPFQCISNIMKSMNSKNELILQLSNNDQVTQDHVQIIFNSLAGSHLRKLTFDSSFNTINDLGFMSGLIFSKSLQHLDINLSHTNLENTKGLECIQRLNILEVIKLNLGHNIIENCDGLDNLRYLQNLKQLQIDLQSNKLEGVDSLNSLSCLNELTDLEIFLTSNLLNDVSFLKYLSPLSTLTTFTISISNLEVLTTDDYVALKNCTNMKKLDICLSNIKGIDASGLSQLLPFLTHLEEVYIDLGYTELKDTSLFEGLKFLKNTRKLKINYQSNSAYNFNEFSHLRGLQNLTNLDLNFYYNYLEDVQGLDSLEGLFKIKFLNLNLKQNGIRDISVLKFDSLVEIETLKLDFSNNKIEDYQSLTKIFDLITLKELEFKLAKSQLTDFTMYNKLSQLRNINSLTLDLWQQQDLADISFLNHLEDLSGLRKLGIYFGCNNIFDASPLCVVGKLVNLEHLDIDLSACILVEVDFLNKFEELVNLKSFYLGLMQNRINTLNLDFLKSKSGLTNITIDLLLMNVESQETIFQGIFENKPLLKQLDIRLSDCPVGNLNFLKVIYELERLTLFSLKGIVGKNKVDAYQPQDIEQYIEV